MGPIWVGLLKFYWFDEVKGRSITHPPFMVLLGENI